jgi:hypothetical protein
MTDIRKLLAKMATQEAAFREEPFLAPCVQGGQVRVRMQGLVRTFTPRPRDFEGWGLFRAQDETTAMLEQEADLPAIAAYLEKLTPIRAQLVCALRGRAWLAYPVNESDAQQKLGLVRPFPVHLVTEGAPFEPILARWDGGAFWFEETDRRVDPQAAERLRDALRAVTPPQEVRFSGLTPEMRTAYALAAQQSPAFQAMFEPPRTELRLRHALRTGGGDLHDFQDRGDYWLVEWTTRSGETHHSAIAKDDLTVLSSGICLSDRDSDFDLHSLVGVIERRAEDW